MKKLNEYTITKYHLIISTSHTPINHYAHTSYIKLIYTVGGLCTNFHGFNTSLFKWIS